MNLLERWDFDESSERLVMGMLAMGLRSAGQTTYKGHLEELTFFNEAGVQTVVSFRYLPENDRPVRLQRLTGVTD